MATWRWRPPGGVHGSLTANGVDIHNSLAIFFSVHSDFQLSALLHRKENAAMISIKYPLHTALKLSIVTFCMTTLGMSAAFAATTDVHYKIKNTLPYLTTIIAGGTGSEGHQYLGMRNDSDSIGIKPKVVRLRDSQNPRNPEGPLPDRDQDIFWRWENRSNELYSETLTYNHEKKLGSINYNYANPFQVYTTIDFRVHVGGDIPDERCFIEFTLKSKGVLYGYKYMKIVNLENKSPVCKVLNLHVGDEIPDESVVNIELTSPRL